MNYIDSNSSYSSAQPRDITVKNITASNITTAFDSNPNVTSGANTINYKYLRTTRVGNEVIAYLATKITPSVSTAVINITISDLPYVEDKFPSDNFGFGSASGYDPINNIVFGGRVVCSTSTPTITVTMNGNSPTTSAVEIYASFSYPVITV